MVVASSTASAVAQPTAPLCGTRSYSRQSDPTHGISFDVVSIRPVEENHHGQLINTPDGDGITSLNGTLNDLLRWDFGLGNGWREDQFRGTPKGFTTDNYDVQAKVAESDVAAWHKLDDDARRLVFRKMLFDRFKLSCHFEDEDRPVYNLIVAKGGLKMHESTPEDLKQFAGKGSLLPAYFGVKIYLLGGLRYGFPEISMKLFADNFLTRQSGGRTVIDKTGLTGKYSFVLNFVGEYGSISDESSAAAPSLFTALQEQLGLKLEPARGQVPVLVIDHVEQPTAN